MAERVERITNLLALLLATREPLTLQSIADELHGQYPDGHDARRAAFERDKALLRQIGVEITTVTLGGDDAGATGYMVRPDEYELPDPGLDSDEVAALQVALAATRPGSSTATEALWKVGARRSTDPVSVGIEVPHLDALPIVRDAVVRRCVVRFVYAGRDREVEPWGMLLRDGFWYLTGYDRVRSDRRTFRIDRMESAVDVGPPGEVEIPADVDLTTSLPDDPMMLGADHHRVRTARVIVSARRARPAMADLGAERVVQVHDDGSVEVDVPYANTAAMMSWVLGHLDDAVVVAPEDLRDDIVSHLRGLCR